MFNVQVCDYVIRVVSRSMLCKQRVLIMECGECIFKSVPKTGRSLIRTSDQGKMLRTTFLSIVLGALHLSGKIVIE